MVGCVDKTKLMRISTQIENEVEVEVELGKRLMIIVATTSLPAVERRPLERRPLERRPLVPK